MIGQKTVVTAVHNVSYLSQNSGNQAYDPVTEKVPGKFPRCGATSAIWCPANNQRRAVLIRDEHKKTLNGEGVLRLAGAVAVE